MSGKSLSERAEKLGLEMWYGAMSHHALQAKDGRSPGLPTVRFRTLAEVEDFLNWYESHVPGTLSPLAS